MATLSRVLATLAIAGLAGGGALAQTAPPINGGMPNPLFRNRMPSDEELARVPGKAR